MDLSIVLVNWNSVPYLRECLTSIYQNTHNISFEIVVIDNASPDGGIDTLTTAFPNITIVKSKHNLGFAAANNIAFQHTKGENILFLNPDTQIIGAAIPLMLDRLKTLSDAGIVGCKLLNTDLSIQTSCIQKYPTILNQVLDIEHLRLRWPECPLWAIGPLFLASTKPVKVESVSGACLMIKRDVFERVNLFSEEYFMYAEDIDLCHKVSRIGLANYYVGEAVVIHHGGKSSGQVEVTQWATIMKFRAMTRFCFKTRGKAYSLCFRLAMGCAAAVRLAAILAIATCGGEFVNVRIATAKWRAVLGWATGFSNA